MFVIAWLLVLIPATAILWSVAGFLFRAGRQWRLLIACGVPAVAVAILFFAQYWTTRTPPAEPGWDIFYAAVCLVSGAATLVVTLPAAVFAESRFGSRAP